jgi:hypothetical protein
MLLFDHIILRLLFLLSQATKPMHPLVRDLYKRVIYVGRDYPLGIDYVRRTWKEALQNPENCPACYTEPNSLECEKEIRIAVGKGRHMVREMIGIIQLKKYRAMKQRYGDSDVELAEKMQDLERRAGASK